MKISEVKKEYEYIQGRIESETNASITSGEYTYDQGRRVKAMALIQTTHILDALELKATKGEDISSFTLGWIKFKSFLAMVKAGPQ